MAATGKLSTRVMTHYYRWWFRFLLPFRTVRSFFTEPSVFLGNGQCRLWTTIIPRRLNFEFGRAAWQYKYRGVTMAKNPLDIALYMMLVWELRPRIIVEIGSAQGGSALWLGDLLRTFNIPGSHVISIDLSPPKPPILTDNVTFVKGDANALERLTLKWDNMPHPWLVIQDAGSDYNNCIRSIRFFNPLMHRGDYFVMEDGNDRNLGMDRRNNGGPSKAIAEFLSSNHDWVVDGRLCDFYGLNATGNINGYLRKT